MNEDARLDEFDQDEWRDICRRARIMDGKDPLPDDQFDRLWDEYLIERNERDRRRAMS